MTSMMQTLPVHHAWRPNWEGVHVGRVGNWIWFRQTTINKIRVCIQYIHKTEMRTAFSAEYPGSAISSSSKNGFLVLAFDIRAFGFGPYFFKGSKYPIPVIYQRPIAGRGNAVLQAGLVYFLFWILILPLTAYSWYNVTAKKNWWTSLSFRESGRNISG